MLVFSVIPRYRVADGTKKAGKWYRNGRVVAADLSEHCLSIVQKPYRNSSLPEHSQAILRAPLGNTQAIPVPFHSNYSPIRVAVRTEKMAPSR